MLALAVVGIAVVVAVAFVIAIAVTIVIAASRLTFDADVEDGKGSIGKVGWRRGMVGVRRMRSLCRRYSRRP